MLGARIFVAAVFIGLAASFYYSSYTLFNEFGEPVWFDIAAIYSHSFLFFPTMGLVALVAFYMPSVIFVDFYWKHVPHGKLRFIFSTILVCALSVYIAGELSKQNMFSQLVLRNTAEEPDNTYVPALWELSPATLTNDAGEPSGCADNNKLCARQPILRSLHIMRKVSQDRVGLSAFARNCARDPLLEEPADSKLLRYCFPLLRKVDGPTCCIAQKRFSLALSEMFTGEPTHSKTRDVHANTLPFKVFFMLIILIIGLLLASWRNQLDKYYLPYMPQLENGTLVGATALLFWPATNQAFLQSAATLYGPYSNSGYQNGFGPLFSAIFGLWALLILFFFVRNFERDIELWIKAVGALTSFVAVVQYNQLVDFAVRLTGSGAAESSFFTFMIAGFALFLSSFFWPKRKKRKAMTETVADKP